MKNNQGFSIIETLMSIGFLTGLVVVSTHIFKKQQNEMINAIQEIEITSTVNKIRMALKGKDACNASFENKKIGSNDIKVIKRVIYYPETDEIEELDSFPLFTYGQVSFGEYNLKIENYRLDSIGERVKVSGETALNLTIKFSKGIAELGDDNFSIKQLKLYADLDELGRIESCSLNKDIVKDDIFHKDQGQLIKKYGHVGIGTNLVPSPLTILNGIQFSLASEDSCENVGDGSIFFHKVSLELSICYGQEVFQLSNIDIGNL